MTQTIIDNVARGWNRSPVDAVSDTAASGLSAAIWSHEADDVQEVWAEPDRGRHIISVMSRNVYQAEVFKDGRHAFSKSLPAGGVQLMAAGVRPRAVHNGRWEFKHLYLPAPLVTRLAVEEGLIAASGALELIDPECARDTSVARIASEVATEMRTGATLSKLRIDTLGIDLAIKLIRKWSNLAGAKIGAASPSGSPLAPWQVRRAMDLLASDLANDPGLSVIARQAGLSAFHFARAFKAFTGAPPHRFLIQLRVERACELLKNTDLAISDIAAQVGYDDPSYLAVSLESTSA